MKKTFLRFGKPEEIVLSDDAAFMTGQALHVDGGASIGKSSIQGPISAQCPL